jgi:hypothetical protein
MAGLRLTLRMRVPFEIISFRLFSKYDIDTTYRSLIKKIIFILSRFTRDRNKSSLKAT